LTFSLQAQLYIAGVIDGTNSGGTPKGVQVCATGEVADISIYGLGSANNGGGTDGEEFTFPALTAAAGTCFWVGSNVNNWAGTIVPTDDPCFTSGMAGINGDDAIELFLNGVVVDVYGDPNTDGTGEPWEYADSWASRTVAGPNTTFNVADWNIQPYAMPYPNTTQTCPVAAMPIELSQFTATKNAGEVALAWSTASEFGNDYFEIEHSQDGFNFRTIGMVEGAGESLERIDYSFDHDTPAKGTNYYRLKQVDFSRAYSYSTIQSVDFEKGNTLDIFPTITRGSVNLDLGDSNDDKTIFVTNINGQQVSVTQTTDTGNFELQLGSIPAGSYFITVSSVAGTTSGRGIVQ